MSRALLALALVLPLAGCVTGKPEYAALPDTGPLTPTRVQMASATCHLAYNHEVDAAFNANQIPDINGLVDNMKLCMVTQGIQVTGWRQPDGKLTSSPFGR
jgi:hypothetical protein